MSAREQNGYTVEGAACDAEDDELELTIATLQSLEAEPGCPNGHALDPHVAVGAGFSCDRCSGTVGHGTPLYGCRDCNYDECQQCYMRTVHKHLHVLAKRRATAKDLAGAEALLSRAEVASAAFWGKHSKEYATSMTSLGALYIEHGEYDQAFKYCAQAKPLAAACFGTQHILYAKCVNNLALLHKRMGMFDEAEDLYRESLSIKAVSVGRQHEDYATSLVNLAEVSAQTCKFSEAEAALLQAREILFKALGEKHVKYATSLNNLGYLYKLMGAYDKAEPVYMEATRIRAEVCGSQHPDYASSLNNLAVLYMVMGAHDKAEDQCLSAKMIYEKTVSSHHPERIVCLNNYANVLLRAGKLKEAEEVFLQVREIRASALGESHPDVAKSTFHLADISAVMGDMQKAEERHQTVLHMSQGHAGLLALRCECLRSLASLYIKVSKFEEAHSLLLEAQEVLAMSHGCEHPEYAKLLMNIARACMKTGRFKAAMGNILFAAQIHQTSLNLVLAALPEPRRLQYIASMDEDTSRLLTLAVKHVNTFDSIRQCFHVVACRKHLVFDASLYGSALGDPLVAHDARVETDFAELRALRGQLVQHLLSEGTAAEALQSAPPAQFKHLVARVEDLERKLGKFLKAPGSLCFESNDALQSVSASLPRNTAIVEYVLFGDMDSDTSGGTCTIGHYAAFVVEAGQDTASLLDIGHADYVHALVDEFLGATRQTKRVAAGLTLRRLVLDVVVAILRPSAQHLFIAPDARLAQLPFDALPCEVGHVLDWELTLSYVVSSRDVVGWNDINKSRAQSYQFRDAPASLVVADPDFKLEAASSDDTSINTEPLVDWGCAPVFQALRGTGEEGNMVANMLARAQHEPPKSLTGPDATVNNLLQAQGPPILHVATHGFFLPASGIPKSATRLHQSLRHAADPFVRCGFAMSGADTWMRGRKPPPCAGTGILTALELRGMNLKGTHLGVFSCCDTGCGHAQRGEGVIGMGRAAMLTGAESVVLTLWRIDDDSTPALMKNFYEALLLGFGESGPLGRAASLRWAQRRHRERGEPFSNWAPFVLYGMHHGLPGHGPA
ncbi:nphp3 [Symbiodinium natans]|uniref:Nphp3 protein n=1 Tax=Symbiodinium natans TaxID=878477 RepID=A0A812GJE3_9DINO|nr:nphp3 [Symbiodinium natans]